MEPLKTIETFHGKTADDFVWQRFRPSEFEVLDIDVVRRGDLSEAAVQIRHTASGEEIHMHYEFDVNAPIGRAVMWRFDPKPSTDTPIVDDF